MYKVSVIIPMYNAASYIERCAISLFEQTLTELEYIFVDDCSTDNSVKVLEEVIKSYPHRKNDVRIILHSENRGSAAARNTGLSYAKGEFLGWTDADDWMETSMYEVLYEKCIVDNLDLATCNFKKVFRVEFAEVQQINFKSKELFIKALIKGEVQGMLWNKIMRRSIIEKENICFLEGNDLGEDRTFLIKVLFYCSLIGLIDKSMYFYDNTNEISITKDPKVGRVYEEINNVQDLVSFFEDNNVNWISKIDLLNIQFRSKSKLLYSKELSDFKKWKTVFPKSNKLAFSSDIRFRHKILGLCSISSMWMPIKIWIKMKKCAISK